MIVIVIEDDCDCYWDD